MTTWISTGTPTFTDSSTTVTFTGVDLIASNVNAGDAMHAPDGEVYEIASVDSATQLTLVQPYRLRTGYAIQPTRGIVSKLRDALQAQISQVESYLSGPLIGRFNGGSAAQPGVSRNTDQDTGLAWLTSNALSIIAGGTEALRLTATEASGGAVQSSETDATDGKLLRFFDYASQPGTGGPWGLGSSHAINTDDADALSRTGFYRTTNTTVNIPITGFGSLILNQAWSDTYMAQVFIQADGGAYPRTFTRVKKAGTWSVWVETYTQSSAVGTVSQSGGVPTGAIIETGSNANGRYTRFADGTQICTNQAFTTSASADVTWTYPAAFTYPASPDRPSVGGSVSSTGSAPAFLSVGGIANGTNVVVRATDTSGVRQALGASLIAIGRWY